MKETHLHPIHGAALDTLGLKGISHGFFTREGGVSQGIYKSLNVGTGSNDEPGNVQENRRRVAQKLGISLDHLATLYQVHSSDVITLDTPLCGSRPKADAMVTKVAGIALGVLTADCGPVLFADGHTGVIGAAHAGWRGALGGVLHNTIIAMEKLGAQRENITAVLGPTIGPENYEVSEDFRNIFLDADDANIIYFVSTPKLGYYLFNLWSFITDQLKKAGVQATGLNLCTYADEKRFFSYRRKTHRNEADYGRQISAIVLGKQ